MPRPFQHHHPHPGFSLLELSAVLAIIAILIAGTFSMGSSVIEAARRVNTNNKLDAIEEALMAFRLANNRLPCPSDATQTDTPAFAVTYGYEAGSNAANNPINSCTGGSPAANFSYTLPSPPTNTLFPGGTTVAEGAVPVKALGLPDEFQWDGWGRKFAYAVWTPLTATNAFITYGLSPNCGAITVENAGHGNRTAEGAYALISYGPDGHGGYLKSGSRYFMGSDNADEWTNCHCNATADTGNYAATYVEQDATQANPNDSLSMFGDIVRFKDRWQMQNAYDTYNPIGTPCSPGFRINGTVANGQAGYSVAFGDIDGDGIKDLIIGAPTGGHNGNGIVYVVFGTTTGFPNPLPLNSLNGTNGFTLDSVYNSYPHGQFVASGDLDGDGYDDVVGVGGWDIFVFYGHPRPFNATYDASNFYNGDGCTGFNIFNATYNFTAAQLADVSGHNNGIKDLIFGMPGQNGGKGYVYVMFGKANTCVGPDHTIGSGSATFGPGVDLNGRELNSSTTPKGATIEGAIATNGFGSSVSIGDINGDGIKDIIIGDPAYSSNQGRLYVVFGQSSWPDTIASGSLGGSLSTPYGFIVNDSTANDYLGASTAVGDVTGHKNGIADIAGITRSNGAIYLIPGHANPWNASYTLLLRHECCLLIP